ncbi:cytochrome c [Cnuella takakiae]|uniref:Cytochrome c n=1 Tax=Cnuella takakiae TaxID=1302690 RepID=A0A1M4SXI7_9BACT|nr:cytochrome c [Cnuella takakiae]
MNILRNAYLRPFGGCRLLLCFTLSLLLWGCNEKTTADALETKGWPEQFGLGKPATEQQVAAWDIDVRPDGKGLPAGAGTAVQGRAIYAAKCASCHGNTGVEGPFNHLVSSDTSKAKTIGNYWPYATTLFDYVRRAMPFNAPGSLTNAEVYHLTAYLLHANGLVDSTSVMDAQTLPKVVMPAQQLFVPDNRTGGAQIR